MLKSNMFENKPVLLRNKRTPIFLCKLDMGISQFVRTCNLENDTFEVIFEIK